MAVLRPFGKLPELNSAVLLVGPALGRPQPVPATPSPFQGPALPSAPASPGASAGRASGVTAAPAPPPARTGHLAAICKLFPGAGPAPWRGFAREPWRWRERVAGLPRSGAACGLCLTVVFPPVRAAGRFGGRLPAEAGGDHPPREEGLHGECVSGGQGDAPPAVSTPGPWRVRAGTLCHLVQEMETKQRLCCGDTKSSCFRNACAKIAYECSLYLSGGSWNCRAFVAKKELWYEH